MADTSSAPLRLDRERALWLVTCRYRLPAIGSRLQSKAWLAKIIAGSKTTEYREMKSYWRDRLQGVPLPFELRPINGMRKNAALLSPREEDRPVIFHCCLSVRPCNGFRNQNVGPAVRMVPELDLRVSRGSIRAALTLAVAIADQEIARTPFLISPVVKAHLASPRRYANASDSARPRALLTTGTIADRSRSAARHQTAEARRHTPPPPPAPSTRSATP